MTAIDMLEQAFWCDNKYHDAVKEELRILEILRKHMAWKGSLQYVESMAEYWEEEHKSVTQERLNSYDLPFTVDEFETIVRWLRNKEST